MATHHHSRVLILGSGPAGYTAAIYAARGGLEPRLVTGMEVGGQMSITTDVENYPGFADVIQGPWLMEQMQAQALQVGTALHNDLITGVDLAARPVRCSGDSGDTYSGDAFIIDGPHAHLRPGPIVDRCGCQVPYPTLFNQGIEKSICCCISTLADASPY